MINFDSRLFGERSQQPAASSNIHPSPKFRFKSFIMDKTKGGEGTTTTTTTTTTIATENDDNQTQLSNQQQVTSGLVDDSFQQVRPNGDTSS
jgi:hypothetical protein